MVQTVAPVSDGELLRRFSAQNDQQAFTELVQRHGTLVFNVCKRILGQRQEAEDATQAVFLTLAHKASSLQNRATAATWLYQVAWHVAMRARASAKVREEKEKEAATMNASRAPAEDPTHAAIGSVLDAEMRALPENLLQPLVLHHLEGCTEEEGARVLGLKLGTFSSRLNRAREMLRMRLAGRGYVLPGTALMLIVGRDAMSAQLTPAFAAATAKVAVLCKTGNAASGALVSNQTQQMVQGALKMLAARKIKMAAASAACVVFLLLGSGLYYHSLAAGAPPMPIALPAPVMETDEERKIEPPPPFLRMLGAAAFQSPGDIQSVVVSPDEKYVAATGDKFAAVWELSNQSMVARIALKNDGNGLRFRNDGTLMLLRDASGNAPAACLAWDWLNGKDPERIGNPPTAAPGRVQNQNFLSGHLLTLSPDESTVFAPCGSANGSDLRALDFQTGKVLESIVGASRSMPDVDFKLAGIALSANGALLACVDTVCGWSGENVKTMQPRNSARFTVWDWKTKRKMHEWIKNVANLEGLQWMPGNTELFVSSFGGPNSNAVIFDAADGREVRRFAGNGALHSDGTKVTTYSNNRVQTFSAADGKELASFDIGDFKYPRNASISSGGRYLSFTLGGSFLLIDLKEKKRLSPSNGAHQNKPYWMQYVADGRLILFDGALSRIYDERGTPLQTFKSHMYCAGAGSVSRDGELLIAPGWTDGQAEVWDIHAVKLLGHLGKSTNAVNRIFLSGDGQWALLGYEYNGKASFFDFTHAEPLGELQGPRHPFFGALQSVTHCVWTKDGSRAFLADTSAGAFSDEEIKKQGLQRPLGLSGAYQPELGAREFWFKNAQGDPIECVDELDLNKAEDTLYVRDRGAKSKPGALQSAADGTFLRAVDDPGLHARFSEDGALLIGKNGVVDVQTGERIHAFPPAGKSFLSPSRTLLAQIVPGLIRVFDVRTGLLVWECALGEAIDQAKLEIFLWHPGESQVAFSLNNSPTVAQVDLFANSVTADPGDVGTAEAIWKALVVPDFARRMAAVQKIADTGSTAIPLLHTVIDAAPPTGADALHSSDVKLGRRMAIIALERIACTHGGIDAELEYLTRLGNDADADTAGFARDAVLRLRAVQSVRKLNAKLTSQESVEWPTKSPPRPGVKPPAPQDF
jgi:RNA polymerase sigma factor (sigma-70 family)